MQDRKRLLDEWGYLIVANAHSGALTGDPGKPIPIGQVVAVNGPRAGALEMHAGLESGRLLRILAKDGCATLRQFVPWDFVGEPACYMAGRYVRVEAGWPDSLAERDIKLADLGQHPKDGGRWIAGRDELGRTITLGLSDASPHWLIAGTTGSGKSYAMRLAAGQLCHDPENRLVLIDAKWGEGLGALGHVQGLMAPVAITIEMARAALSWAVGEMRRRYETGDRAGRLIVVIDELQEIIGKSGDSAATEMVRRLVSQGRGARVYVVMGTQHPTIDVFGDPAIKRNLVGRVALKTLDAKSSEVAVGASTPRADHLLGAGDSYCIVPSACHRAQLAYIPERDLAALPTGETMMETWPEYDPEAGGTLPEPQSETGFDVTETALSLLAAHYSKGRPWLKETVAAEGRQKPGSSRARRLLAWGQEVNTLLHQYRHKLSLTG